MKNLKRLFLLISAVACLLVLAAVHDWWVSQYDARSSYGRGVRRLSAVFTINTTTEQNGTIRMPSRPTTTTTRRAKLPKTEVLRVASTTKRKAANRVKKYVTIARSHPNATNTRVLGRHFNLSSSAARIFIANSILKSRPMKIVETDKVIRILLVTYFRGGSTFLGDLLQQNWKTFYHFEPLHYASFTSRVTTKKQIREAFDVISHLFRCNFGPLTHYVKWAMTKRHQFLFKRNRFLWSLCHIHPSLCFTPYYLTQLCLRAPVQVMKVTRLYLRDALEFAKKNSDLKIKIIYLHRDPRGIFSSRRVLDWCMKVECASPQIVCKDMSSDVEYLRNNSKSLMWMRYEDMCLNPKNVTVNLYKRLGIPYTTSVSSFLRSHTTARKPFADNPYSTHRNTTTVAFEWLHRLSFPEIDRVQSECSGVMRTLGYKKIGRNITLYERGIPDSVLEAIPQSDGVSVFRN